MDRAQIETEITAIREEEAKAEAIRALLDGHGERMSRISTLRRKIERQEELDAAVAVDAAYIVKLEKARLAEAEARQAHEAMERNAVLRARREVGTNLTLTPDAAGPTGRVDPTLAAIVPDIRDDATRSTAALKWKTALNHLRRLEKWPTDLARVIEEAPAEPEPKRKRSLRERIGA